MIYFSKRYLLIIQFFCFFSSEAMKEINDAISGKGILNVITLTRVPESSVSGKPIDNTYPAISIKEAATVFAIVNQFLGEDVDFDSLTKSAFCFSDTTQNNISDILSSKDDTWKQERISNMLTDKLLTNLDITGVDIFFKRIYSGDKQLLECQLNVLDNNLSDKTPTHSFKLNIDKNPTLFLRTCRTLTIDKLKSYLKDGQSYDLLTKQYLSDSDLSAIVSIIKRNLFKINCFFLGKEIEVEKHTVALAILKEFKRDKWDEILTPIIFKDNLFYLQYNSVIEKDETFYKTCFNTVCASFSEDRISKSEPCLVVVN